MNRYLSNPEVRMSNTILVIILIGTLLIALFIQRIYYEDLKDDYVKSLGAVTARVLEKDPQMEPEIVPFITKGISAQYAEKGEKILKRYGLTKNLENSLFPYYKNTFIYNTTAIFILFSGMMILLLLFNYVQYRILYERIRDLTKAALKVVEGEYNLNINEYKEGDFSKLVSSFNKMGKTIRKNISDLKKEKVFLVNILSDISHQLKTPLSSLIVYNDILMSKALTKDQQKNFLSNTNHQLLRMKSLIYNLLKLAKIDAKAIELDMEEGSLNVTVQEAMDALERKASEKLVHVSFHYDEEIKFRHDKMWLQEALINILKNAIEHSNEQGEIKLQLMQNPIYIRMIVEDFGVGISVDDLPNIFKRFYKAKNSKNPESVGIGLALAKSIIEAHHGIIEAHSKLKEGTSFIITFLKY